jgi:RNA polymerase sigma factor (sigma-70 family)
MGPASFEAIVRQDSPALIRTLTLIVLDREAAADIAQETFMQPHHHWEKVADHPNLSGWIYRVAINRARDYRRSLVRAARLVQRLGSSQAVSWPVQAWQPEAEFVSVLRGLPQRQRAAAALRYVGDLTVPEVAAVMGISTGAVQSHLYRARMALKDVLEVQ